MRSFETTHVAARLTSGQILDIRYDPQDLLHRITGSRIDPQPYLRYLERKAEDIYGCADR